MDSPENATRISPASGPGRLGWAMTVALTCAPAALAFYAWEQIDFVHGRLSRGQVFGRDFINDWTGARLLLEGHARAIFTEGDYATAMARLWGPGLALHNFSYPPSLLALIGWTGALPYGWAIAAWSAAGVALLLIAAGPLGRRPLSALAIVCSPAALICLDDGQNGLLTGALLVGGLTLSNRRPLLGGALIGLVTVKPQLGLLIPLALLLAGRWRTIAGAAASAAALLAVSLLIAGPEAWRWYLTEAAPFQRQILEHRGGTFQVMTPAPFMAGRLIGLDLAQSYALQALASAAAVAIVARRFWRIGRAGAAIGPLDIALLLTAGFVASPYGFNYDMAGLALALLLAERADPSLGASAPWRWASVALWTAPLVMMAAPMILRWRGGTTIPFGPILVAAGLGLLAAVCRERPPGVALSSAT